MKTKTKPEAPAPKTVSTPPTAVENNNEVKPGPTLAALEEAFEQLYKSTFGVLAEIRDRKLYAPDWDSFREYGEKRWRTRVREITGGDLAPFRAMIGPDRNAPKAPKAAPVVEAPAPAKPAKKSAKAEPKRAQAQLDAKKAVKATSGPVETPGQIKNRHRLAGPSLRAKLEAAHPGLATEIPGVNNLPAVGVIG